LMAVPRGIGRRRQCDRCLAEWYSAGEIGRGAPHTLNRER
jgi:hypothetical protein